MKLKKFKILLLGLLILVGCEKPIIDDPIIEPQEPDIILDHSIVKIAGLEYKLPISYSRLIDDGWVVEESAIEINDEILLDPNTYYPRYLMRRNKTASYVGFYNPKEVPIKLKESLIVSFDGDDRTWKTILAPDREDLPSDIMVFNRLNLSSSKQEVINLLGEPTYKERETSLYTETYVYEFENMSHIKFDWDKETEKMKRIEILNFGL